MVVLRRHTLLTPERLGVLTQALIDFQAKTHARLLLVPFQRSQDYDIAVKLRDQLPEESDLLMLEDPRQLKGVFQDVDMTIAMRLHALIMAASEGCRCFALSYDPKVSQLMTDLTLPGYEPSALPDQSDTLVSAWQDTLNAVPIFNRQVIRDRVDASLAHQKLLHQLFG